MNPLLEPGKYSKLGLTEKSRFLAAALTCLNTEY
jgi:hypothetical protein